MLSTLIVNSKSALFLMCGWLLGAMAFEVLIQPSRAVHLSSASERLSSIGPQRGDAVVEMRIDTHIYDELGGEIVLVGVERLDISDAEVQEAIQSAHDLALELQDVSHGIRKVSDQDDLFLQELSDGERAYSDLPTGEGVGVCDSGSSW